MKKCCSCNEHKLLTEYHRYSRSKDGHGSMCKVCTKSRNALYYKKTPEKNDARRASTCRLIENAQEYVFKYLCENPCIDCGEDDPVVLEFDHVRGKKSMAVSVMVGRGTSIQRIVEEIEKCEVRCASCHRRVTARRGNWFTVKLAESSFGS